MSVITFKGSPTTSETSTNVSLTQIYLFLDVHLIVIIHIDYPFTVILLSDPFFSHSSVHVRMLIKDQDHTKLNFCQHISSYGKLKYFICYIYHSKLETFKGSFKSSIFVYALVQAYDILTTHVTSQYNHY